MGVVVAERQLLAAGAARPVGLHPLPLHVAGRDHARLDRSEPLLARRSF